MVPPMKTVQTPPPTSVRLTEGTRRILTDAARRTHRSQSYLVEAALKQYLPQIAEDETQAAIDTRRNRFERLLALGGSGAKESSYRSIEEVDAHIRWLRGNE